MIQSKVAGVGKYIPEKTVTNDELSQIMDTSDAWIQERTGIKERHYAKRYEESSTTLAYNAAKIAIERAGITAKDIDFIVLLPSPLIIISLAAAFYCNACST